MNVAQAPLCDANVGQGALRAIALNGQVLLKRVFDTDMQICPNCRGCELRSVASMLERLNLEKVLDQLRIRRSRVGRMSRG